MNANANLWASTAKGQKQPCAGNGTGARLLFHRDATETSVGEGSASRKAASRCRIALIARKEFADRFRSGWVVACIAVWLGAIGLTSLFGLVQVGRVGWQGYERTVVSLLNLVQYLVPLLALLIGHDLVVGEREDRTLPLIVASGLSRAQWLAGKFLGGCLTLAVPLVLGFAIAGTGIGLAARDRAIGPFITLAVSGLVLGIVFLAVGLLVSTACRTRVRALVISLLAWCVAVFVFDLVALGVLIATKSPVVAHEIEVVCDTTHVNAAADPHASYDALPDGRKAAEVRAEKASFSWLLANPVDLFRAINLGSQPHLNTPWPATSIALGFWLGLPLGASLWKFKRLDL